MQLIGTINTSYYCEQDKPNGPVVVLTTGAYRVAEFDYHTGSVRWHRVVPAPQKSVIESWLNQKFPPSAPEAPAPKKARPALAGAIR
jgi:hypothetical protein